MKMRNGMNNGNKSLNILKHIKHNTISTLAQQNLVSLRQPEQFLSQNRPLRILLPDYFNIPKFNDSTIDINGNVLNFINQNQVFQSYKELKGLKRKLKDLSILADGMKRAKNIKEQSRYYFIQGVIMNNSGMRQKSIQMFQKFLKIVLFIKDDKSIQLALNSIALSYMYLNKPTQALPYHQKQVNLTENSQKFIGKINIGLCKQMQGKRQQAHEIYMSLANNSQKISNKKMNLLQKLINRTKSNQVMQNYFLTEQQKQDKKQLKMKKSEKQNINNISLSFRLKKLSNEKHNKSSISLSKDSILNQSYSVKKYDSIKVNYAIFSAEENINTYLQDIKHSFGKSN